MKIKSFLIMIMIFSLLLTTVSMAEGGLGITDSGIQTPGGATTVVSTAVGLLKWVGGAMAIIMLMFAGIKYMTAGADEKAAVKESLLPLVIGAVLIFGAISIVDLFFTGSGGANG